MSFDRHATAQIVLRGVRSLGIDAHINSRNDICIGKDKISATFFLADSWEGTDRPVVFTSLVQRTRLSTNVHITMALC